MPNIKSAKKRVDLNEKNRAVNKSYKSELATAMKKYVKTVEAGDKELATKLLPETFAILDKNVARNLIHKNKADRKKAEFNKMLQNMTAAQPKKAEEPKRAVKVEEVKAEEKAEPAKKTTRKTATKKTTAEEAEKPAKKTTARKTATKKAE